MKYIALILAFTAVSAWSQTVVYSDNMETTGRTWNGYPTLGLSSGYITGITSNNDRPASVSVSTSPSRSFALYGIGNASSSSEREIYKLPNVTGLDPTRVYLLRFRVMAMAQNQVAFIGSGLDVADSITVSISTNGGVSYVTESKITGFGNSWWGYDATGIAMDVANGVIDVFSPTTGGDQTNTGEGYATYILQLTGITQLAVNIGMRANFGGVTNGEWWFIDDVELVRDSGLPVELTEFAVTHQQPNNVITWTTASEHNSKLYELYRITSSGDKTLIETQPAAGFSISVTRYRYDDVSFESSINYYELVQIDTDGFRKTYPMIAIDNRRYSTFLVDVIDVSGKSVYLLLPWLPSGIYFEIYSDGSTKKIFK